MNCRYLKFSLILFWISLIIGCSPSRRFDYRTAYKFRYIEHHTNKDTVPPDQLSARLPDYQEINLDNSVILKPQVPEVENSLPDQLTEKKPGLSSSEITGSKIIIPNLSMQEKKELRKNTIRKLKEVKKEYRKIKKRRKGSGFSNIHPRLQGFIFVAIGLGVVLVSATLISAQTLSVILVILGFGLVAFGFLKILGIIK